ncbi:MAG: hypothetical protein DMG50_17565 [Acidobacteria bacterium]|nr:MAG: hypothetical protein DMG50_17565 [Acidobacteriota bacterium]
MGPALPPASDADDALSLRRKNLFEAGAKIMSGLLLAVIGETMEVIEKSRRPDRIGTPLNGL